MTLEFRQALSLYRDNHILLLILAQSGNTRVYDVTRHAHASPTARNPHTDAAITCFSFAPARPAPLQNPFRARLCASSSS